MHFLGAVLHVRPPAAAGEPALAARRADGAAERRQVGADERDPGSPDQRRVPQGSGINQIPGGFDCSETLSPARSNSACRSE